MGLVVLFVINLVVISALQDLYIGANVAFHNHKFILIDADEYAVDYMEKHANEFPQANIQFILPRLRNILDTKYEDIKGEFNRRDAQDSGKIHFLAFMWVALTAFVAYRPMS